MNSSKDLFFTLYTCSTEDELHEELEKLDNQLEWKPYGDDENNYGVIENQQASPVPALIEKLTNSIDAIMMRKCLEADIDPKSQNAPQTMEEAITQFFPESQNWDLRGNQGKQAEDIQIIADGPRLKTSLIIYDNGEGQHPDSFEKTFLSLLKGNKNEISFVQGKYNMGGAGALVFCGNYRYQLIGSRRFNDIKREFGFTLVRRHPYTDDVKNTRKNTWYEYLLINGKIPRFIVDKEGMDLGLLNRKFNTGTVIKLYSYDLPQRSVISRELNRSINEFLFEPALPIYTIDNKSRYPDDKNLARHLFGLKRRMESSIVQNKYVKRTFSLVHDDREIGKFTITVYVFNPRTQGKNAKETKRTIRNEFFKNNMSVLFSLNGQVHGSYTSEFISRSLGFGFIKDYVLIHVDCTELDMSFRNELFMASRDRLKKGEHSNKLRKTLSKALKKSELKEIFKDWKSNLMSQSESNNELLKELSENLPLNSDLIELLNQTFDLKKDGGKKKKKKPNVKDHQNRHESPSFNPQRFPSSFKIKGGENGEFPMFQIPFGGDRVIQFSTDVEDEYFHRTDEPGELKIALLKPDADGNGGDGNPEIGTVQDVYDVNRSSPKNGVIRLGLEPNKDVKVGDVQKIQATLTSPSGDLSAIFMVKISERNKNKEKGDNKIPEPENLGLPELKEVFEKDWDKYEELGMSFSHADVMYPFVDEEKLNTVYINMDSHVLKSYLSKLKNEEQFSLAKRKYSTSVYFHTLFLYITSKKMNVSTLNRINQEDSENSTLDLTEYLQDIFSNSYSEFLLNFEMSALIEGLAD